MRGTLLPLLIALAAGAHAEVKITGAYPTDRDGNRVAPVLGEPFFLTVTLAVSKETKPYRVTVDAPSGVLAASDLRFGLGAPGAYWTRLGEVAPLFDGPMDVIVTCSAAKKPLKLRIVPASPAGAVETYRPQRLSGAYGASVLFDRAASRLLAWTPIPESGGFQNVAEKASEDARTGETAQPVALTETRGVDRIDVRAECVTAASSVRTNLALLRRVPMAAISSDRTWRGPEARIESTHPEIVKFVAATTKGMGANAPVADVALALYGAVLKRSSYATTGALPDALSALRSGKGECGDLSALFVASCRAAGIPARPVSGFAVGTNAWHVWAEFQIPGIGWIPVDPAYALGRRAHSTTPLYFGVVPELRDRVALVYGFTQTVGTESTTFLQTPAAFAFDAASKLRSASFWCRLQASL